MIRAANRHVGLKIDDSEEGEDDDDEDDEADLMNEDEYEMDRERKARAARKILDVQRAAERDPPMNPNIDLRLQAQPSRRRRPREDPYT